MPANYTNCIFYIRNKMNILIKIIYIAIIFGMYGVVSENEYREETTKTGEFGSSLSAAFARDQWSKHGHPLRRKSHE